eukprot:CAMPEP_0113942094 /NCGR_PEP_ID=MMETSP1339-20121228/7870_1 /TAXON_ID=94617 /ORGANISM="Fibrocapsa japonica" /LENGTH=87 /DNA_ID=CAMNT_0000946421 /DNA_START=235 /DNA_END=498 /DNA_ORIENTATION=+ /assembly_acc=CAM_ASM_000762
MNPSVAQATSWAARTSSPALALVGTRGLVMGLPLRPGLGALLPPAGGWAFTCGLLSSCSDSFLLVRPPPPPPPLWVAFSRAFWVRRR